MNGKQIILTADRPPVKIEGLEDRLLTRFKWGLQAEIEKRHLHQDMGNLGCLYCDFYLTVYGSYLIVILPFLALQTAFPPEASLPKRTSSASVVDSSSSIVLLIFRAPNSGE